MEIKGLPFSVLTDSVEETESVGRALALFFKENNIADGFIAMKGDLGAGKTAFTRGFASVFCPEARVKSPTYAIMNVYRGEVTVHHLDTYRITSDDDLYSTGFYDIEGGFIICEWSENIEYALPKHRYVTEIKHLGENARSITVQEICEK